MGALEASGKERRRRFGGPLAWLAGTVVLGLAGLGAGSLASYLGISPWGEDNSADELPGPMTSPRGAGSLAETADPVQFDGSGTSPLDLAEVQADWAIGELALPVGSAGTGAQEVPDISAARRTPTMVAAFRVLPSVVSVRTTQLVHYRSLFSTFGGSRAVPGLGSGFVIDSSGIVLTNEHVVRGADQIEVVAADGSIHDAELVGSDALTDIAVLRISGGRVPPAPLGSTADLFIGEPAVAIGNPSGYSLRNPEATVTAGVISGLGRDIQSASGEEVMYADMIQTDASINPGNSGGPLANADGDVIGVNSSILSRSGGSEGLGFAIPIDRALVVAGEILDHGRVRRPWAGLEVLTERADDESVYGRPLVTEVYEGTPGEEAGLRVGDEIVSVNGRTVNHDLDWQVGLVYAGVGSQLVVVFRRGETLYETRLALEEIPSGRAERIEALAGLDLVSVTADIAQERGLEVGYGALVLSVEGPAEATRLREGDVIWAVNGTEVRSAEALRDQFSYYARAEDGWVRLHIARGSDFGTLRPFRIRGPES